MAISKNPDAVDLAPTDADKVRRTQSATWLTNELHAIAANLRDNAKEDDEEAEGERDREREAMLRGRAEAARGGASQIDRVLAGYTSTEHMAKMFRETSATPRRKRAR